MTSGSWKENCITVTVKIWIPLHCLEMLLTVDCYDTVSKVTWEKKKKKSRPAPLGVAKLLPMAFCGHVVCVLRVVGMKSDLNICSLMSFLLAAVSLIWLGLASGSSPPPPFSPLRRLPSVTQSSSRSRKVPAPSRLFVSISQLTDITARLVCSLSFLCVLGLHHHRCAILGKKKPTHISESVNVKWIPLFAYKN